ncbi:protein FAM8A1 [Coccinella septempunctata]|uniref:protein FAM8A1 n=1 Tax=Coccinella septempunctata TaxID=41139 RepID=UPI001D097475|nr:protein FAM8A1 [Coccinella septempunctata]
MEGSQSSSSREITREEYINSLNQWLDSARLWGEYSRHYFLCSGLANENTPSFPSPNLDPSRLRQQQLGAQNGPRNPRFAPGTHEFVIPPMWKRLVAELLDFAILLIIKLILTFAAVETFNFVTVENLGLATIEKYLQNPRMAMQMYMETLSLELLHRCVVCCYEVYWLRGGLCATPGKRYMGLMVIQVDDILPVPGHLENKVRVTSCSSLGFQNALTRAILKNLFIAFLLPICVTMYIFRYNRTGYDLMSKSLVVEYNPNVHPID